MTKACCKRREAAEARVKVLEEALVVSLVSAGDYLSVCAQTTGGTAGRDDGLVDAVEKWRAAKAALASHGGQQ